jgi:YD repeat-containing protein
VVDPNGLTTTLSYDPRGRLTGQTVGDEHTAYTYDPAGQLTRITLPDGSSLSYTYDAAHRLTQVTDSLGNTLTFTLDAAGNRIRKTPATLPTSSARRSSAFMTRSAASAANSDR